MYIVCACTCIYRLILSCLLCYVSLCNRVVFQTGLAVGDVQEIRDNATVEQLAKRVRAASTVHVLYMYCTCTCTILSCDACVYITCT